MPFEQSDQQLVQWVAANLRDVAISLSPPSDAPQGQGISLYLFKLSPANPTQTSRPLPLDVILNYLVSTWAEQPETAHRWLGQLVFAAMGSSEFELDFTPLSTAEWSAFGVRPRPAFILRMPCRQERPQPPGKLVRKPLVVEAALMHTLDGVIVTPQGVPLLDATVELPAFHVSSHTDARGHFHLRMATLSNHPDANRLIVRAKGREQHYTFETPLKSDDPLIVQFDITEE